MPRSSPKPQVFTLPLTPEQLRAQGVELREEESGSVVVGSLALGPITAADKPLFEGVVRIEGDLHLDQVRAHHLGSMESCENLICRDCHFIGGLGDLTVIKKSLQVARSVLGEAVKLNRVGESVKLTEVGESDFRVLASVDSLELHDCDGVVFSSLKSVGSLTHTISPTDDENNTLGVSPTDLNLHESAAAMARPFTPFPELRAILKHMTVRHGVYSRPLALPRLIEVTGRVHLNGEIVGRTGCRGVLARVTKDLILAGEGSWDNLAHIGGALTLPLTSMRSKAYREPPTPASLRARSPFPSLRFVSRDVTFITTAECCRPGTAFIPESCYGKVTLAGLDVSAVRRMREDELEDITPAKIGPLLRLEINELILNGATVDFPPNLLVVTLSLKARGTLITAAPLACIAVKSLDIRGATLPGNAIKDKLTKKPLWLRPPDAINEAGKSGLDTVELIEVGERGPEGMRRFLAGLAKHRRLVRDYEKHLAEALSPDAAMAATEAPSADFAQLDGFSICIPAHHREEYQRQIVVLARMLSLRLKNTLSSASEGDRTWDFLVNHAGDAPIKAFIQHLCSGTPEETEALKLLTLESFTLARILADLLIHSRLSEATYPLAVMAFVDDALETPAIRGLTIVALTRGAYAAPNPADFNHPLILQALRSAEWELMSDTTGELRENLAKLDRDDCRAIKDHWFREGVPAEALASVMAQARLKDTSLSNIPSWFVPCEEHCELVVRKMEKIISRKNQSGIEGELSVLRLKPEYWDLPVMKPILALIPRLVQAGVYAFLNYPRAAKNRGPSKWWTQSILNAPLSDEQWRGIFLQPNFPRELWSFKPRTMSDDTYRIIQLTLI